MLKGILAISGQPGLYKLVAEAKNKVIVESLVTQKRLPVHSTSKISTLEDIAIFTNSGDLPLKDILQKIHTEESGGPAISAKSADNELKKYFEKIVPDYDKTRVYVSDIKKVILWYNILQENGLLNFTEEETPASETEEKESE